eukprot:COSAG01_NODE_2894_length_6905_cov_2.168822_10_plen_259_part_00
MGRASGTWRRRTAGSPAPDIGERAGREWRTRSALTAVDIRKAALRDAEEDAARQRAEVGDSVCRGSAERSPPVVRTPHKQGEELRQAGTAAGFGVSPPPQPSTALPPRECGSETQLVSPPRSPSPPPLPPAGRSPARGGSLRVVVTGASELVLPSAHFTQVCRPHCAVSIGEGSPQLSLPPCGVKAGPVWPAEQFGGGLEAVFGFEVQAGRVPSYYVLRLSWSAGGYTLGAAHLPLVHWKEMRRGTEHRLSLSLSGKV